MKGVTIYKSRYDSTKQFSEWLKEATNFDLFEASNIPFSLRDYEIVVIGSAIHKGHLSLQKWIIRNWELIKDKCVILMLTSGTSDMRFIQKTIERSFPENIRKCIQLFPVGGKYLFKKMTLFDRISIKIVAFFTRNPETKNGMLTERDEVNQNNLKELINFIRDKGTLLKNNTLVR